MKVRSRLRRAEGQTSGDWYVFGEQLIQRYIEFEREPALSE